MVTTDPIAIRKEDSQINQFHHQPHQVRRQDAPRNAPPMEIAELIFSAVQTGTYAWIEQPTPPKDQNVTLTEMEVLHQNQSQSQNQNHKNQKNQNHNQKNQQSQHQNHQVEATKKNHLDQPQTPDHHSDTPKKNLAQPLSRDGMEMETNKISLTTSVEVKNTRTKPSKVNTLSSGEVTSPITKLRWPTATSVKLLDGLDQTKSSNQRTTTALSAFGDQPEDQFQEVSNKVHLEIAGSSHQLPHLLNTQRELKSSSLTPKLTLKVFMKLNSNLIWAQSRRLLMTESQSGKSQEATLVPAPRDHSTLVKEPTEDGGYQSSRRLMPSSTVSTPISTVVNQNKLLERCPVCHQLDTEPNPKAPQISTAS